MLALFLRFRVRAFLRERGGAGEFWIETRINLGERMNNRLLPIVMNDLYRGNATRCVFVDEFFGRFFDTFSAKRPNKEGETGDQNGGDDNASHATGLIAGNMPPRKGILVLSIES